MTPVWRFIDAGPVKAPEAFGAAAIVAASVAQGGPPVLMTSVWARAHIRVGWFEDVDAVVDLDAARRANVGVFRLPAQGGGTELYDGGAAAMWSWFVPEREARPPREARRRFKPVVDAVLGSLGLGAARLGPSGQIRWKGSTLGAITVQSVLGTQVVSGYLNLCRPDLDRYRLVARAEDERGLDRAVSRLVGSAVTPADISGEPVTFAALRDALVAAARADGLDLRPEPPTPAEQAATEAFARSVAGDGVVRRVASSRFLEEAAGDGHVGFGRVEGSTTVRAGVEVNGTDTIVRAMLAGDMSLSPADAMDRVAGALTGAAVADRDEIERRIESVLAHEDIEQPAGEGRVSAAECAKAVMAAVRRAHA